MDVWTASQDAVANLRRSGVVFCVRVLGPRGGEAERYIIRFQLRHGQHLFPEVDEVDDRPRTRLQVARNSSHCLLRGTVKILCEHKVALLCVSAMGVVET